jgi:DNA-binding MarR family transcriptional regulator
MTPVEIETLRAAFGELMGAERRLRGRDPRHAQIRVLVQLAKDEEVTAGELAKRAELSPGAMTAMLDQLEAKEMITRRRSETDRRQVIVRMTDAGQEKLKAKRALWERMWEDGLAAHSEDELRTAAAVMRTIAGVLDQVGVARTENGVLSP